MARFRRILFLSAAVASLVWARPASPQEPVAAKKKSEATKFLRVQRDARDQAVALETATVRYVAAAGRGVTVDLIGVVHVGDKKYYEALNKRMEEYDVVLYELVGPEGTSVPKGGKRDSENPVSLLQGLLKNLLDLELQLEHVDYTRKNFVHADLSPDKMAEAMRERGEDGLTLALSVAADFLRKANLDAYKINKKGDKARADLEDLDFMSLLFDPDSSLKLKRVMAEQFEAVGLDDGLGPTLNTLLVTDRNKAALKVFQRQLAAGKKKVAIFYGAAHMPDFEQRLRDEFGLKKDKEEWLTAWDLKPKRGVKVPALLKLFGDQ